MCSCGCGAAFIAASASCCACAAAAACITSTQAAMLAARAGRGDLCERHRSLFEDNSDVSLDSDGSDPDDIDH